MTDFDALAREMAQLLRLELVEVSGMPGDPRSDAQRHEISRMNNVLVAAKRGVTELIGAERKSPTQEIHLAVELMKRALRGLNDRIEEAKRKTNAYVSYNPPRVIPAVATHVQAPDPAAQRAAQLEVADALERMVWPALTRE
jgi:hypothetical protein